MQKNIRYYILVGDEKTWEVSFTENLFGFSEQSKGSWNTTNVNDYVAFYCTIPIKKIIGFGQITEKFIEDKIFFPDEKFFKRAVYKYRIKFEKLFVVADWKKGLPPPKNVMLNTGRRVVNEELFSELIKSAEKAWKTKLLTNLN